MISSSNLGAFSVPDRTDPAVRGVSAPAAAGAAASGHGGSGRAGNTAAPAAPRPIDPLSRRGTLLDILA